MNWAINAYMYVYSVKDLHGYILTLEVYTFMISDYSFLTDFQAKEILLKTIDSIKTNKV